MKYLKPKIVKLLVALLTLFNGGIVVKLFLDGVSLPLVIYGAVGFQFLVLIFYILFVATVVWQNDQLSSLRAENARAIANFENRSRQEIKEFVERIILEFYNLNQTAIENEDVIRKVKVALSSFGLKVEGIRDALTKVDQVLSSGAELKELEIIRRSLKHLELAPQNIKEVRDAVKEVKDGVKNVKDGVEDVRDGVKNVKDGVKDLREGVKDVREGVKDVREGVKDVRNGVKDVGDGVKDVRNGVKDVSDGVKNVSDGVKNVRDTVNEVNKTALKNTDVLGHLDAHQLKIDKEFVRNADLLKNLDTRQVEMDKALGGINAKTGKFAEDLYYTYNRLDALLSIHHLIDINSPLPVMKDWALFADLGHYLIRKILAAPSGNVIDIGSGISTLIEGYALKKRGNGKVISLEHDPHYFQQTAELIKEHRLENYIDLYLCPLIDYKIDDKSWLWYDLSNVKISGKACIVFVDGPPGKTQKQARYPAVPLLRKYIGKETSILLDDGRRQEEQEIAEEWSKKFRLVTEHTKLQKGLIVLTKSSARSDEG